MSLPLFDDADDQLPPQAARLAPALHSLAEQGVYLGTSSWKYEGWLGSIYSPERYVTRGRFSKKKFEAECLTEYAKTFPTVCGDFAFYQFPTPDYWQRLFHGTPSSFLFGFKVPEEITVALWPGHARYGARAGQANESFLNADIFQTYFAQRLQPYAAQVGTLIFEFGTFNKKTFPAVADFYERLDSFLAALPPGFRYAVEIRNEEYLLADYFATLARHNVAHVFNAWTRMPTLGEQITIPDAFTADFTVVRALLRHGRTYEQAVKSLEPYQRVQEPDLSTRRALRRIVDRAVMVKKPAFLFVNNRLEGNAPETIEAVVAGNDA
ncbi:MAG TPA: DUF72 domain-containing protein [Isosphaeraceae bacterium]|nr:DUF72 domain-containing protein [Isosphaeraceae bacterium]